jgi:hypothetical protein
MSILNEKRQHSVFNRVAGARWRRAEEGMAARLKKGIENELHRDKHIAWKIQQNWWWLLKKNEKKSRLEVIMQKNWKEPTTLLMAPYFGRQRHEKGWFR